MGCSLTVYHNLMRNALWERSLLAHSVGADEMNACLSIKVKKPATPATSLIIKWLRCNIWRNKGATHPQHFKEQPDLASRAEIRGISGFWAGVVKGIEIKGIKTVGEGSGPSASVEP